MLNLIAVFLVCSGIGIAVHIAIDLRRASYLVRLSLLLYMYSVLILWQCFFYYH